MCHTWRYMEYVNACSWMHMARKTLQALLSSGKKETRHVVWTSSGTSLRLLRCPPERRCSRMSVRRRKRRRMRDQWVFHPRHLKRWNLGRWTWPPDCSPFPCAQARCQVVTPGGRFSRDKEGCPPFVVLRCFEWCPQPPFKPFPKGPGPS